MASVVLGLGQGSIVVVVVEVELDVDGVEVVVVDWCGGRVVVVRGTVVRGGFVGLGVGGGLVVVVRGGGGGAVDVVARTGGR